MRGAARLGLLGRGRLPGARGLRAPPPPLLLLALLPLLPAPGAAAAQAPRPPALPSVAAGPSVSLYLSEDEVRRLIGEWGRPGRGGHVARLPVPSPPQRSPDPGRAGVASGSRDPRPPPAVLAWRCGPCLAPAPGNLPASPFALAVRPPWGPPAAARDPDPARSILLQPFIAPWLSGVRRRNIFYSRRSEVALKCVSLEGPGVWDTRKFAFQTKLANHWLRF